MKEDRRADRRRQIEAAAYAVLLERGYAGASVLEVAKKAKASNETLYRWYGDKLGLFAQMVKRNAAAGFETLTTSIDETQTLEQKLSTFGVALLRGILSDGAIALNRAAAADGSGDLGKTIAQHGRDAVMPLLADLMASEPLGAQFDDTSDAAETFIALLVGDLQARRVIGALPEPDLDFIRARTDQAVQRFLILTTS